MSFAGLHIGASGLMTAQRGLDLTSQNIANAHTEGYTRRRIEQAPRPSYSTPDGKMGAGVEVEDIARLRDHFLDTRFRSAVADGEQATVRADFLEQLESLSGEPDQGVSSRLSRLWDAAESWANDPSDTATRRQVLNELGAVAEGIRNTASSWDTLEADYSEQRSTLVGQVNRDLQSLQDIDRRIAGSDPDRIGPELFDQRDMLVDDIVARTGADATVQDDGTVRLELGGERLSGTGTDAPGTLQVSADGQELQLDGTDVTAATGGELGGVHEALTSDFSAWRGELNRFADGFMDAVNGVNTQVGGGDDLLQAPGPGGTAGSIELISDDPSRLKASADGNDVAAPHDATNAEAFADLRVSEEDFEDADGNMVQRTIDDRFADMTVGLAGAVESQRARADSADSVARGAELARKSEHGVSTDEEMVQLVKYQRALEASSRVMTTVDEALDTLVNRTGLVGR